MVIVIGLLAVAVAVCYSMLRVQIAGEQVASNQRRVGSAREAARIGISTALGKLHQSTWAGVSTPISGNVDPFSSYNVTFTVGDDTLNASHPDYNQWPFRLTLLSTGSATTPGQTGVPSTHQIRVVVKLIPRAVSSASSDWTAAQNFTLYQYGSEDFKCEIPFRVVGPVRVQGKIDFAAEYPSSGNPRNRYMGDLNLMRFNGYSDDRPFSGPLNLPTSLTTGSIQTLLNTQLGLTLNNISQTSAPSLALSTSSLTYRLYTGGPTYNIATVSGNLINQNLQPNPLTNPLGLFYNAGELLVGNNTTVQGTLISPDEVELAGTGVTCTPVVLSPLDNTSESIRLPAIISRRVTVDSGSNATINGNVLAWDRWQVDVRAAHTIHVMTGTLVAKEARIERRSNWNVLWGTYYTLFQLQLNGGTPYFPLFCQSLNLPVQAPILLQPDSTYRDHYQQFSQPIYTAAAGDPGLFWEILSWKDLPHIGG
jgi:hypothetical protein